MNRGKYSRKENKGLSKIQLRILDVLDFNNPVTGESLRKVLGIPITFSNFISFSGSLRRLRERRLIKSLGRNSKREHLWVRENK